MSVCVNKCLYFLQPATCWQRVSKVCKSGTCMCGWLMDVHGFHCLSLCSDKSRRRRNQGHLSSPSTDGEATPPPPHPVKKPIPSTCNSYNPITPPDPSGSNGPPILSLNSRDSNSSPIRAAGASPALSSAQWPVSNC